MGWRAWKKRSTASTAHPGSPWRRTPQPAGWRPVVAPEMEFYLIAQNSNPHEPLRPPVGLDALNTRGALKIPDLREPEAPPRKLTDACLDAPPKYSNAQLLPPARDKKAEKAQQKRDKAQKPEPVGPVVAPVANPAT